MIAKGSFEDYLYIFIGLVWIGFSIYKARQKKKSVSPGKTSPEKEKSFFENLVNEFLDEKPESPYVAEVYKKEATRKEKTTDFQEKKVFSYDDYYEESNALNDFDVFEKNTTISTHKTDNIKSNENKRKKNSRIDLRKAVVYSEILNRKYY